MVVAVSNGRPRGFQLRGRGGHGGAAQLRRAAGAGALRCRCGGLGLGFVERLGIFSWDIESKLRDHIPIYPILVVYQCLSPKNSIFSQFFLGEIIKGDL